MISDTRGQGPWWVWGVVIALALILLSRFGGVLGVDNAALRQRFAPQPTATGAPAAEAPQFDWSLLPTAAQQLMQQVQERFRAGQAAPVLTPVAQSTRLRVEISELRPKGSDIQVVGTVTNVSGTALDVPVSVFQLRDSANATYAASSTNTTHLAPGASTPLDLTVPLPAGRGLSLIVQFPPDPPIEQVLLVAPK